MYLKFCKLLLEGQSREIPNCFMRLDVAHEIRNWTQWNPLRNLNPIVLSPVRHVTLSFSLNFPPPKFSSCHRFSYLFIVSFSFMSRRSTFVSLFKNFESIFGCLVALYALCLRVFRDTLQKILNLKFISPFPGFIVSSKSCMDKNQKNQPI